MPTILRPIAVVCLFLSLAACDSGEPGDTGGPPEAEVSLVRPLDPFEAFLGDNAPSVDVRAAFQGKGAGALKFSATVIRGSSVEVRLTESNLTIVPTSVGPADIRVEARGTLGGMTADTVHVEILDPCPVGPPPGSVEVFPLAVDQRWSYDTNYSSNAPTGVRTRVLGRTDLRVVTAEACRRGTRVFVVREQGTSTREINPYGTWLPSGGPVTVDVQHRWTVTADSVTTTERYQAPFGPRAPRFAEPNEISGGGLARTLRGDDQYSQYSFVLREGIGPVSYSYRGRYSYLNWIPVSS